MNPNLLKSIARKYYIEDLRDSLTPGTALSNVISRLEQAPDYIPEPTKDFLRKSNLNALLKYACKQVSLHEFTSIAKIEQEKRKLEAEKHRKEREKQAEINARRQAEQQKIRKLLQNYDLHPSDVKTGDGPKLIDILGKLDRKIRLSQDEFAWLMVSRVGLYSGYYTQRLRESYHKIEAEHYLAK